MLAMLTFAGCPSPNRYGTPRTIPVGKVAHVFAAEAASYGEGAGLGPTYEIRLGAMDRVDAGIRLGMLTTIGGDLKFNFERSKQFDLAIDLNIQYTFASTDASDGCDTFCGPSGRWMYAYAPLLIGLNVDPDFALVGQLGGAHSWLVSGSSYTGDERPHDYMWLGGFGLAIRASQQLLLQPEVSYLREFETSRDRATRHAITFGLGFAVTE